MWIKLINGMKTLAGTITVLAAIVLITLLGVVAFAVTAFFFWGIIAILVLVAIIFLIWDFFNP